MEQYKKILRRDAAPIRQGGARAAKLLSQQWRDLGAVVENILMKAFTTFAGEGGAGGAMREFIAWLEPKSGSIANGLNRIAQDAIAAGKKVVQFVIDIGEGATTWQEFTTKADHAATEIERLAAALGKILDFGDKVGRALRTGRGKPFRRSRRAWARSRSTRATRAGSARNSISFMAGLAEAEAAASEASALGRAARPGASAAAAGTPNGRRRPHDRRSRDR